MTKHLVAVDQIEVNWSLNRERNEEHVRAIAAHMNERGFDEDYPVRLVKFENGALHLAAGFHRYAAAVGEHIRVGGGAFQADCTFTNLPIDRIWAEQELGNLDRLIEIIQRDNFRHDPALDFRLGLALTQAEKKEQCLRLLLFPETFKKDVRELGAEFGVGKSTAATWKDDACALILEIADLQLSDEQLLNLYSLTPGRFSDMLLLVKSARRASAEKKEGARVRATAEFETSKSSVQKSIDALCAEFGNLDRGDIQRKLYTDFGIADVEIGELSAEELKKERAAFRELQADLQFPNESLWGIEFSAFDAVLELRSELNGLGPLFELQASADALDRARKIDTGGFESQERDARLTELENLKNFLPGVIDGEIAEREDQAKAHDELKRLCDAAGKACSLLVQDFRERAADRESYPKFVARALEFPKTPDGYSDTVTVVEMRGPEKLKNTGRAYAVRGVAEKLRADLTSEEPPKWMQEFLKSPVSSATTSEKIEEPSAVETPIRKEIASGPEPSALDTSSEKEQASAPIRTEHRVSNADFDLINLQSSAGAAAGLTSEKRESESAVTAALQKSENEKRADARADTPSPRSGISDFERALQNAADEFQSVLPIGISVNHDAKAQVSELIRNLSSNQLERIAIYHALFLGELSLLK